MFFPQTVKRMETMEWPAIQDVYRDAPAHCYGCGRLNQHSGPLAGFRAPRNSLPISQSSKPVPFGETKDLMAGGEQAQNKHTNGGRKGA